MDTDEQTAGTLWLVATPIGCFDDLTIRAHRILSSAEVILAEDTRKSGLLLAHHNIETRMRSFHSKSPESALIEWSKALQQGATLALISDAGMPVINDPGERLVRAAYDVGASVRVAPGASAVLSAVAVCGLRAPTFRFVGYLPRAEQKRKSMLLSMANDEGATVFFESPRRCKEVLGLLSAHFHTRQIAVCRELTKTHEEVLRGTADAVLAQFADREVLGEVTIVIEARGHEHPDPKTIEELALGLLASGLSKRDASHQLSQTLGIPRKEAYSVVLGLAKTQ